MKLMFEGQEIYADSSSDKSRMVSIALPKDNWADNEQIVTVEGILSDETKQWISPTPYSDSQNAYYDAGIMVTKQSENTLTFRADNEPTQDLNVFVLIQEVEYGTL